MAKLLVTRHGETDYNVQRRFTGSTDIDLNETGIQQAHELAEKLSGVPIDIIVASSQRRAVQTASIIASKINKPVTIMDQFVERKLGVFEGLTGEEVKSRYSEALSKDVWHTKGCAPEGGETLAQVEERVLKALGELKISQKDKNILLVSHGATARAINCLLSENINEDFWTFKLQNCGILEFEF